MPHRDLQNRIMTTPRSQGKCRFPSKIAAESYEDGKLKDQIVALLPTPGAKKKGRCAAHPCPRPPPAAAPPVLTACRKEHTAGRPAPPLFLDRNGGLVPKRLDCKTQKNLAQRS